VLTRLTQGRREPFVLGDGLGELALGLEETLLQGADALGGVLQATAEDHDLLLEALDLGLELSDLPFVLGEAPLVLGGHGLSSLPERGFRASRGTLHRCPSGTVA